MVVDSFDVQPDITNFDVQPDSSTLTCGHRETVIDVRAWRDGYRRAARFIPTLTCGQEDTIIDVRLGGHHY